MDNVRLISVDAGRSGIKHTDETLSKNIFASKHGEINFVKTRKNPTFGFKADTDLIVSVDNKEPMVLGEACDMLLPKEFIRYATDDKLYLKYSIGYTLSAVARLANNGDQVYLSLNLTSQNIKFIDEDKDKLDFDVIGSLSGQHNVKFYNPQGEVLSEKNFEVIGVNVLNQGHSALFYYVINDDLTFNPEYSKEGIIIDIGRKSVDVISTNKMNVTKPRSYNLGTEYVFSIIKDELLDKEDVHISNLDIEKALLDGTPVQKGSKVIDLSKYRANAVRIIAESIRNSVVDDFGTYNPYWVIIAGGGVHYFKELLLKMFDHSVAPEDPVYTNVFGLEKLAMKSLKKK